LKIVFLEEPWQLFAVHVVGGVLGFGSSVTPVPLQSRHTEKITPSPTRPVPPQLMHLPSGVGVGVGFDVGIFDAPATAAAQPSNLAASTSAVLHPGKYARSKTRTNHKIQNLSAMNLPTS